MSPELDGLRLEDLPADHPIRQEVARLTVRLALLEGTLALARAKLASGQTPDLSDPRATVPPAT